MSVTPLASTVTTYSAPYCKGAVGVRRTVVELVTGSPVNATGFPPVVIVIALLVSETSLLNVIPIKAVVATPVASSAGEEAATKGRFVAVKVIVSVSSNPPTFNTRAQ
jgi:hypothetical protein